MGARASAVERCGVARRSVRPKRTMETVTCDECRTCFARMDHRRERWFTCPHGRGDLGDLSLVSLWGRGESISLARRSKSRKRQFVGHRGALLTGNFFNENICPRNCTCLSGSRWNQYGPGFGRACEGRWNTKLTYRTVRPPPSVHPDPVRRHLQPVNDAPDLPEGGALSVVMSPVDQHPNDP